MYSVEKRETYFADINFNVTELLLLRKHGKGELHRGKNLNAAFALDDVVKARVGFSGFPFKSIISDDIPIHRVNVSKGNVLDFVASIKFVCDVVTDGKNVVVNWKLHFDVFNNNFSIFEKL